MENPRNPEKPIKTHYSKVARPKYLSEYFNRPAGPPPTCTTRRRTRQPSDLHRPDLTVGGQFRSPTCRPLASGESGFPPRTGTRGRRWDFSEPPSPIPPLPKGGAGNPLTAIPVTTLPPTSCARHHDVTSPMPAPASLGPPRSPATASTRHRVLPPWLTPQRHVTSVPGPHHDVMLTSSAEKRQMHTFSKFNVINDQMSRFQSFSRAKEVAVVDQLPRNLSSSHQIQHFNRYKSRIRRH